MFKKFAAKYKYDFRGVFVIFSITGGLVSLRKVNVIYADFVLLASPFLKPRLDII